MSLSSNEPSSIDRETSLHVRRAVDGDTVSTSWIVGRFTPLLLAQAYHRLLPSLRAHVDPEDVVQDVWIRVLPKLGELTAQRGYTRSLLKYLGVAVLRRVRDLTERYVIGKPRAHGSGEEGASDPMGRIPEDRTGIVSHVVREERKGRLHEVLTELSERDRELIVLRGIEQQPPAQVAALLDMTENAVAVAYHRALKRLRDHVPGTVLDDLVE